MVYDEKGYAEIRGGGVASLREIRGGRKREKIGR
jgi:hypothetical protein